MKLFIHTSLALLAIAAFLQVGQLLAQVPTTPANGAFVCAYNAAITPPTSGQFYFIQCDSAGRIIVGN